MQNLNADQMVLDEVRKLLAADEAVLAAYRAGDEAAQVAAMKAALPGAVNAAHDRVQGILAQMIEGDNAAAIRDHVAREVWERANA